MNLERLSEEGGIVITDQEELANRVNKDALHGLTEDDTRRFSDEGLKHCQVICGGSGYNMTVIQASQEIHQLIKNEVQAQRRTRSGRFIGTLFKDSPSCWLLLHLLIKDTLIISFPRLLTSIVSGVLEMNFSGRCTKKISERGSNKLQSFYGLRLFGFCGKPPLVNGSTELLKHIGSRHSVRSWWAGSERRGSCAPSRHYDARVNSRRSFHSHPSLDNPH